MKSKHELNFEEVISDRWAGEHRAIEIPIAPSAFVLTLVTGISLVLVVFGWILVLTLFWGSYYDNRADINANKELTIPAFRGIITDRFDEQLVRNTPSFSLVIDKTEIVKNADLAKEHIRRAAAVLDIDEKEIWDFVDGIDLEKNSKGIFARDISLEQAIDLRSLKSGAVVVEDDYRRDYTDPLVFAHVLGYTGVIDWTNQIEGKTGLEKSYDQFLRGQDGSYVFRKDAKENILDKKITREAVPGSLIKTTIDGDLQRYFYQRFKAGIEEIAKESGKRPTGGVGLAINPKTGEILALLSFPEYDNNKPAQYLNASNQPLFNRAISGVYSPGSTIKPLVALAALSEGVATPNFTAYSPGYLEVYNPYDPEHPNRFLDWKAHGEVNVHSALARSSNVFFYIVGGGWKNIKGLGINRLNEYWRLFGFGQKTGVDLPAEEVGFLPDPEEKKLRTGQPWRIGDTYNVSIGQGDLTVSPIRLLSMITTLADDGKMMRPYLLHGQKPEVLINISDKMPHIKEVQKGMRDAVAKSYGTANTLFDLSYKTAGKTGSVQVANKARLNALFVGYGPYEDPQIAILVLVENAQSGTLNATPIARDVLEWYYNNRL